MVTNWNRTVVSTDRLDADRKLTRPEGLPTYGGRHIIGRDTQIDGGVYTGVGSREAIVVDSKKYPGIGRLYEKAKSAATGDGRVRRGNVLRAVYQTVAGAMPNQSSNAVEELISRYGVKQDGKITLDSFLAEGVGVCRHDALACGVLLELFKRDGHIRGTPSVDRNTDNAGGHAWCRYTNGAGKVYILDVMQGFPGSLQEAEERRARGEDMWDYRRPGEMQD